MKIKSFICFALLLLSLGSVFAEPAELFDSEDFYGNLEYEYIRYGDTGLPLDRLFIGIGAVDYSSLEDEPWFNDYVLECLITYQSENGLAETGLFDFETLDLVLLPAAHDGYGDLLDMDDIVWIPMHGGKKHHKDNDCSNMIDPRQLPRDCAISMGFDPCKRCYGPAA